MNRYLLSVLLALNYTAHAQQWHIESPRTDRPVNTYYFATAPSGTDDLYAFGARMGIFDTDSESWTINPDYTLEIEFENKVNTIPTLENRRDVCFAGSNTGFIIAQNRILKTDDKGANWRVVLELSPNHSKYGHSADFTNIHFPTPQTGYAVGTFDKIFKTTDGGEKWTQIQWSDATAPYREWDEVHFRTETEGYAVGYEIDDILLNIGVYKTVILKTIDGGASWDEIVPLPAPGESDHQLHRMQFTSANTAYLALINRNRVLPVDKLLKSTNGGKQWSEVDLPGAFFSLVIRDMHWFSDTEGLLIGGDAGFGQENKVYTTDDGGQHWEEITLKVWPHMGLTSTYTFSMAFQGEKGIIVGSGGHVSYTKDGGNSWQTIVFPFPRLRSVDMLDTDRGYAAGENGLMLKKSASQGWDTLSYHNISENVQDLIEVDFFNEQHGAIRNVGGAVFRTDDGGQSWKSILDDVNIRTRKMQYHEDVLHVLARIQDEEKLVLLKNKAGEDQWSRLDINNDPSSLLMRSEMQVVNDQLMFVQHNEQLLVTENGAVTWDNIDISAPGSISKILFLDRQTGWVTSDHSREIWKTTDGGNKWERVFAENDISTPNSLEIRELIQAGDDKVLALVQVHGSDDVLAHEVFLVLPIDKDGWQVLPIPYTLETSFWPSGINVTGDRLFLAGSNGNILNYSFGSGNTDPVLSVNTGIEVPDGGSAVISAGHLKVTDGNNTPEQIVYTLEAAPTAGTLMKAGSPLSPQDTFTQSDIDNGALQYQHNGSEIDNDSFSFSVTDGAGGEIANAQFMISIETILSNENEAPGIFSIYPNPTKAMVTVQHHGHEAVVVAHNAQGQFTGRFLQVRSGERLDLSGFRPGFYFLTVTTGSERQVLKLVVE